MHSIKDMAMIPKQQIGWMNCVSLNRGGLRQAGGSLRRLRISRTTFEMTMVLHLQIDFPPSEHDYSGEKKRIP